MVSKLKLDRSAFSVASLTDETDDKAYWHSCTPYERLRQVEILRRINYGHRATSRLQRVLEITEIDLPHLKINKKAAGRLKDLADLENLP